MQTLYHAVFYHRQVHKIAEQAEACTHNCQLLPTLNDIPKLNIIDSLLRHTVLAAWRGMLSALEA